MSPPLGLGWRYRYGDVTASQMRQAAKVFNFGSIMHVSNVVAPPTVLNGVHVHNALEGYRGWRHTPTWIDEAKNFPPHVFVLPKDGES